MKFVAALALAVLFSLGAHAAQPLSALCSGAAAHDLKIHLSDVRNQDDTVRDSGDATFRVCDNIANTGRDAPRYIRSGPVYDEYIVSGLFIYATTGHADPLLYGICNIDIFTKASDGVSPGDVRWVCEPSNSWMNVATGSAGNAGNPGPVGFAGDPQSISYRPEVLDGAVSVLNWNAFDATISSASNPIQPAASVGCYTGYGGNFCMNVPTASGPNMWYAGMAVRPSCSGACPAGMTNNQLYYASPLGEVGTNGFSSTEYALIRAADMTYGPNYFMTSAQGSGTTTFSFRVMHYHWTTIPLLDQTGLDNWSPVGTTTRVTRKVYPAFVASEKLYWEETGLILPMNLSQTPGPFTPSPNNHGSPYYTPNLAGTVIGGSGPGDRPDLGIMSEWAAQAFIAGGEANWDYERLFTLGGSTHGQATTLNEATGRIPAINNGPPTGPGGNGSGNAYPSLGAPQNNVNIQNGAQGMVDVNYNVPAGFPAAYGQWNFGTATDHMPSFTSIDYIIFGDRHLLDFMRWQGNRGYMLQRTGPGPELGQGYLRDNNAQFTDGHIYHYYAILYDCCQGRGYAWMMRDITYPAAFGGDNDIERSYYNDFLIESRNYYPLWLNFKNGPSQNAPNNTNYSTSIAAPGGGGGEGVSWETFIVSYEFDATWNMVTFLHEPLGSTWMTQYQRYFEGNCGAQLAGALPYYCLDYYYSSIINNGGDGSVTSQQGSTGLYSNGVDAQDFGTTTQPGTTLLSGGKWSVDTYIVTPGDPVMLMYGYHIWFANGPIDQLPGNRYFSIIGPVDNTPNQPHTFFIQCTAADHAAFPSQCPVAGQAFTGFTRNGVPIANEGNGGDVLKYRLSFDPGAGGHYSSPNYEQYGGQNINGLHILGYNVSHAMSQVAFRGPLNYNNNLPINNWDPTVVIPGLPTPINSIPSGGGGGGGATLLPSAPAGKQWVQTFADEFNAPFNTSVWDVDHYCGGCGSPGGSATTNNGILTVTIQTSVPDTRTIIDTWTTSGGVGNHAFSQRYGFFVYDIKLPTCSSGEYDVEFFGRDNWTGGGLPVGKYAEMAIASGKSETHYRNLRPYQADGNAGFSFMADPDVGVDVTLAYHQYGLLWVNDGSPHGSVTMYFDGNPFSGPYQLLSAGWDVGLFFDLYWSPEQAGNVLGGQGVDACGSVMQMDWVRAYQAQ